MVPHRIHFIFGLTPDFGGKPFSFVHYLSILSASVVNRHAEIIIHCLYEPETDLWHLTKRLATINRISTIPHGMLNQHYAHIADLLRLTILQRDGGIYLDVDTFCVRPFEPLRQFPAVMGIEPNTGLCNAVILAAPRSEFISAWIEQYNTFEASSWNYHSVKLPYALSQTIPSSIHVEDAYSFFFPSYDDPMYLWLWKDNLSLLYRMIGICKILSRTPFYLSGAGPTCILPYLRHLLWSKNAYYDRLKSTYCIHLWESLWWKPYLQNIDVTSLRRSEGMFRRLVEEVVG